MGSIIIRVQSNKARALHIKEGEEQNREEEEMAQTKLGGGRNREKK